MSDEPLKFFIYTANDTSAEILSRDFSHTLLNAIPSQHHFSLCRLAKWALLTVICGPIIHEACSAGANGLAAQYWNTALGFPGHATCRLAFTPQPGSPRRSLGHVDDFIHNFDLLVVQTDAIHCICTQWNATLFFMESLSCINQHKLQ